MDPSAIAPPPPARIAGPHDKPTGRSVTTQGSTSLHVTTHVADPPQVRIVERHLVTHLNAVHAAALAADVVSAGITRSGPVRRGGRPGRGRESAEPLLYVLLAATPGVPLTGARGALGGLYLGAIVAPRRLPDVEPRRAGF